MTAIKASSGSAGETTSKILAASASDIIIGDFKQEIIAGSANNVGGSLPNSGTVNWPVYIPTSNVTAIPWMNGVPTSGGLNVIPNLISRSVSPANTGGSAPYVPYSSTYVSTLYPPNRAASDPTANGAYTSSKVSSATPSVNGRYISPAQWNSHFLIPRNSTVDTLGSTSADSTPTANFVPPDWVIVTRGGVKSVTSSSPGFGTGGLNDPTLTNNNYAIGRYAYAVYNEGGLLDMNAAGYPGTDATSGSNGLTSIQIGKKGSLALADLTQLAAGSVNLTQAQINNIVGWRNYASAQPPTIGGTFGSFTFTPTTSSNWLTNFVQGNTNGFLQVVPPPAGANSTPTDQAVLSRQQLISLTQSLNISPDFLQYMGTFSRALEQPSFTPNVNLPKIVGTASPPAPPGVYTTPFTTYQGNNSYYGGESAINMRGAGGFLGVRVAGASSTTPAFTRWNGTSAYPGEPLVKTKFALSWLGLVTTNATNTSLPSGFVTTDPDPIKDRFGLTRTSTSSPWVYNHGITDSNGNVIIGTLAKVAAANREPDFAELLKAAINAGSVGKAGPSGQGVNDQYVQDTSGDLQILKLMADLIDQQKTDNYPTWIQYTQNTSTGSIVRNIYGDQDLPYFYRWNYYGITTQVPSPILASTDMVTDSAGNSLNHTRLGSVSTPGSASYMIIPQIWNPHDANTPVATGGGPTTFRIVAATNLPGSPASTAWSISGIPGTGIVTVGSSNTQMVHFDGAPGGDEMADVPLASLPTLTMTAPPTPNSYIQFTDGSAGKAFREPTLLWRNNYPTGVTLSGTSRKEDASLTGNTYFGILIGDIPVSWNWTDSGSGKAYFSQTSTMEHIYTPGGSGSNPDNIDFQMQYLNSSGTWITYQESYVESTQDDIPSYTLFVNKNEPSYSTSNAWANPLAIGVNGAAPAFARQISGLFDPRTNRFTSPVSGSYTSDDPSLNGNPTLDAVTMVANNVPGTGSVNSAVAASNFVLMKTNRPTTARGQSWEYTTPNRGFDPAAHWYNSPDGTTQGGPGVVWAGGDAPFCDGLLSQNNPSVTILAKDNATVRSYYYEDADGIARRAMAGYVPASGTPTGTLTNTTTTVGLPLATSGATFTNGIVTPTSQSQSRPILLHRPFHSVAEMSYAFRGTPWKNIDFFTPESGDTALLDVFCVNQPPPNAMIAGKVDLNTRQAPVLKAIFSSAYRDEFANLATPPSSGTLPPLSSTEAGNLANTLVGITTSQKAWEGPLSSIADIVGHFVYPDPGAVTATDVYQYTSPANSTEYTFGGFSAALSASSGIWDASNLTASQNIQRFRESAIRPLADCGQTRVWNLLIDVVAQTGRYPQSATGLDQFFVNGQTRFWVHVAIDRYTGQVIDKQVENVTP
jgi:hypothetical protein